MTAPEQRTAVLPGPITCPCGRELEPLALTASAAPVTRRCRSCGLEVEQRAGIRA